MVVPIVLRERLLQHAHAGHIGIVKTKQKMRQSYWWPGIDRGVENFIRQCSCFQELQSRDSPVQHVEWPTSPFAHLAMDIAGPKTDINGQRFYILVVIDYHSRYVISKAYYKPINSRDVIAFLRNIFSTFGLCLKLTTDNGSVFTSWELTEFLRSNGIVHNKSPVYNPQSNGLVKRVNRNMKKCLLNTPVHSKNCQIKLDDYLFVLIII